MSTGSDTNQPQTSQDVVDLKSQGHTFIGRYYNVGDLSKNLTNAEAKTIISNGLAIVAIWENGKPQTEPIESLFNYNQGFSDGSIACYYAGYVAGQPPRNSPIYFAVDCDYSEEQVTTYIIPYFQGVNDAFTTFGDGALQYPVGVYGSELVCYMVYNSYNKNSSDQRLATYTFLSGSTGWRKSMIQPIGFTFNIVQTIMNPNTDIDESADNNEGSFSYLNSEVLP